MNISPRLRRLAAAAVAFAIFLALAVALRSPDAWAAGRSGSADDVGALATALFQTHVVGLEVLGVLLTAAMIGALVIARPLGSVEDRRHYLQVSEKQLEQTMRVSDLDAKQFPRAAVPPPPGPEPADGAPAASPAGSPPRPPEEAT